MLEAFDCPAILVSPDYKVLATNRLYETQFGPLQVEGPHRCFEISHGYPVPCDQAGEDCPLAAAMNSGHKERVLHVHLTPRGKEHVDVEMMPILDDKGGLLCFVELLRSVPTAGAENASAMMVGTSKAFNKLLEQMTRVSRSDASVLLLGESGVGKELAASAIHRASERSGKPLVTLECAGLSDSLFESELFGHVKGAFTGAHSNKVGLVELADGGTLFLDEIGDVPLSMQVKLLRLLESGSYRPVGSAQAKSTNFRLICATHKDIKGMVARGEFREDLYYRINVFPIRIPSLAERKQDLPLLVDSLIKRISPDKAYHLTESAMKLLFGYDFPGNIRELRNLLTRAVVLSNTNLISAELVRDCIAMAADGVPEDASPATNKNNWMDLKTAERQYLKDLMAAHGGDKAEVAKIAGISVRSLYRKLEGEGD
ncbi:sigma-54 interaction domain-containing protein [Gilvimarinus sp. F26214L]|uniref:sigma-54 interaction domain-containing protein n=1 Tax=Gilvimarinus sp. DZF01 TaxID=3461371 RepID=UPI00404578DA